MYCVIIVLLQIKQVASTGSYKLETIIKNACFLGTYEVPRDYMEEQLKLYYDDNQFHIPEKIVFKLYII